MKPWRGACEENLKNFSNDDSIRFWKTHHDVNGEAVPIFNYRFEHTLAVVKNARWLVPQVGADLDIVECASWLHDCAKKLKDPKSKDTHAMDACVELESILKDTDFPSHKIEAVKHAIAHHVGLSLTKKLEPLETACLWDCDKLSKIGVASLVHFGCISGAFQPISTQIILERGEEWLALAQKIVASFNTPVAQVEGARRLKFITKHYQELRKEWAL